MAKFVKGDVVVVPFPFSDLSEVKRRPALVITAFPGSDVILCQITSQNVRDNFAIALESTDFAEGSLSKSSNIRPNRLFTCDQEIILYRVGSITAQKLASVISQIIHFLQA
jgi:mRNA interferase MazF